MCGICGFISDNDIGIEQLRYMNNKMTNRGPDDSGEEIFAFKNKYLGLAHRRLSILDLSEKGHQPFCSDDNNIVLVFNGEIYNFYQLKKELTDYKFISNCDTEVIIAAYKKWGLEFVNHIDGMFAIALFDKVKNILVLVRDRVGKKPLYYYYDNGSFIFASTLKSIIAYPGFSKKINKHVIPRFIYNGYIAGSDCIYENVYKIRPGEMLIYDGDKINKTIYWSFVENYLSSKENKFDNYEEAKAALKKSLVDSVQKRMVADVPVGAFLSGGFDSSLVTAIAQSLSNMPLKTFSIGFEDKDYDEAPYAKDIAKHLGTEHTNYYVTTEEMLQLVFSIPEYYDEPFADSSQIPSMLVARIAKEKVSVVLTGDGGDELFCGYNMYDKLYTAQKIEPIAKVLRAMFRNNIELFSGFPFSVSAIMRNGDERNKTQFGRGYYEDSIKKMMDCSSVEIPYDETYIPVKDWQIRRMLLDSTTYLPDNNLCKVDRATMRYSLEARNPLLDTSVIEMSFKIPHNYKYHKKDKKHILKDVCYDYIPESLLDRPKKGFAVPIDKWLLGPLKSDLLSLTRKEYLKKQGIFNVDFTFDFVNAFIRDGDNGAFSGHNSSKIVWPLYMFQKWYQYYME